MALRVATVLSQGCFRNERVLFALISAGVPPGVTEHGEPPFHASHAADDG